ncbi:MAG: hypothetical protein IH830_06015 [Planctomycetes bacterium]|nr:hypothetical protein [Planctomycetota bacterium]
MNEPRLRRRPLRIPLSQLFMAMFGWMNPQQHHEYKRLSKENRALRRALRDPERSAERPDENPHKKEPERP